jgi:ABC-type Fe3+/spermidine/putrescine transport system ATPase subunit
MTLFYDNEVPVDDMGRNVRSSLQLYVTHDQEEAMLMSDRIAIMREGRIVQIGTPADLYRHPETPFAASFLGETNLLPCHGPAEDSQDGRVVFADGTEGLAMPPKAGPARPTGRRLVSIRPQQIRFLVPGEGMDTTTEGVVRDCTFVGSYVRITIRACGQDIVVKGGDAEMAWARIDRRVRIGWRREDAQILHEE